MKVQSYLSFEGRCDEALAFYKKALGAEVTLLMRYSDAPPPAADAPPMDENCGGAMPPGDKVMHSVMRIGETELMATDGRNSGTPEFKGIMLSLGANTDAEARRWFDALADGGSITQPLMKTFFSSSFGMCNDRFGVSWVVVVHQPA